MNVAIFIKKDIGGFEVAVDNPFAVRITQSLGNLPDQARSGLKRHPLWRLLDHISQRATGHVGHDNIRHAAILPIIMDGQDARVLQPGDYFDFTVEAFEKGAILQEVGGKNLDGDLAADRWLFGQIDIRHAAMPKLGQ
jgi:hypothetical protein